MECFNAEERPRTILAAKDGSLWVATSVGPWLLKYDDSMNLLGRVSLDSEAASITENSQGDVYVRTDVGSVVKVSRGATSFKKFFFDEFLPEGVEDEYGYDYSGHGYYTNGLAIDSEDNVWLTFSSNNVMKLDKNDNPIFLSEVWVEYFVVSAVAVDTFDNVWIACPYENTIVKLDSNGNLLDEFSSGGIDPTTIIADSSGGVWVHHTENLIHFSATGKILANLEIPDSYALPHMDVVGNFWFTNYDGARDSSEIVQISGTGQFKDSYFIEGEGTAGVSTDSSGNVWTFSWGSRTLVKLRPLQAAFSLDIPELSVAKEDVDSNLWILSTKDKTLKKFTKSGTPLFELPVSLVFDTQLNPGRMFADDRSGHIWVCQYSSSSGVGAVSKVSYSGEVVGNFAVGRDPRQIVLDLTGNIYVDCTRTGLDTGIWKLKPNGQLIFKFAPAIATVVTMIVDASNNNLMVLTVAKQLLKFDAQGNMLGAFNIGHTDYGMLSMVLDSTSLGAWVLSRNVFKNEILVQEVAFYSGEILTNFTLPILSSGNVWVMDKESSLWLNNDSATNQIIRMSQRGNIIGRHSIDAQGTPTGLHIDNQNNVWVTTSGQKNKLLRLTATPITLTSVPTASPTSSPSKLPMSPSPTVLPTKSPVAAFITPPTGSPITTSTTTTGSPTTSNVSISPTTGPLSLNDSASESQPTIAEDLSGLRGFFALFILTLIGALALSQIEFIRFREARLFLAAIRERDRLLFRLQTKQSVAHVHPEIPGSISQMFLNLVNAKAQYEIMLLEVHSRAHLDRVDLERAMQTTQLALFALILSYNMPNQSSTNMQDPDNPAAPEGDYMAIADAGQAAPGTAVNLSEATNRIANAIANLTEGTVGTFNQAKVKLAEQDATNGLRYMHRFALDASTSTLDVVNEALRDDASQWRENGTMFKKVFKQCVGLLPRFPSSKENRTKVQIFRGWFPRLVQFPYFYGLFIIFIVTIFLSFAAKVNRTNSGLDANDRVPAGLFVGNLPFLLGGYGQTFIFVPPQYNLSTSSEQASGVPVLYGVMHCVLFLLGMLPIPFMRGFWRDAVQKYPPVRGFIPIDDFTYFHRLCAWLALCGLLLGCFIWLVTLGIECGLQGQSRACLAFDLSNSNPIDNVLVLRFIIWMLWFPIMPLMYYVRRGPWSWLPKLVKRFYYEIVSYLHLFTAFVTVLLALICRFTVFYPVLISWIPYFIDWFREIWFHTHKVTVNENQVKWFSSIHDQRPTSVRLSFRHNVPKQNFGAGQWMYLMIPSIDYNWHPFSIASASRDQEIELHIGVIASGVQHINDSWVMPKRTETWTYRLWQLIRRPKRLRRFNALIRGPYGTAFSSCFNPSYNACVVIGAGTGLTAAESVLREIIHMRRSKQATPPFTWFVWSCRRVDDMMWCWDTLVDLIYDCCQSGILDIDLISNRPSDAMNVLDWLGVALFVTQATESQLKEFVSYRTNLRTLEHQKIEEWLFNQIVAGALDDEDTHVRKLLRGVHQKLVVSGYLESKMTVAYCGPSALATTISAATQDLGGNVEFSSDNQ